MAKSTILHQSAVAFAGDAAGKEKFCPIEYWQVQVDGRISDRIVIRRGVFVTVVAITPTEEVVLIRQFKYAVQETLLELPGGGIEEDEQPEDAAHRELREETGYTGEITHVIGPYYNMPDKMTEQHYVVKMKNAKKTGSLELGEEEVIENVELLPAEETMKHIKVALHCFALSRFLPRSG